MKRDRVAYKMFESLQNRRVSLTNIKSETDIYTLTKVVVTTENCLMGCCIKLSYKFYKFTEHVISFVTGCLGWAFGFALVSAIDINNTALYAFYYSLISTLLGIIFLAIRSQRQRHKLLSWRKETVKKINHSESMRNVIINSEEEKENELNIETDHDNIFDAENRMNKNKDITADIDIFHAKSIYHQKLYSISHLNFFFRKAYGLMVALPWKLTIGLLLDNSLPNDTVELLVRFIVWRR